MTRTRMAIAVTAALALVHLAAAVAFLDDPGRIKLVHDAGGWAASLFGAFGAVMAARAFAPGDYLRKVWVLLAVGASLLVAGHAIRSVWNNTSPEILFADSPWVHSRLVVVFAANVAQTWGVILLAYTYAHSGLDVPRSAAFNALWAVTSALALALLFNEMRQQLTNFDTARHAANTVTGIVSTVADAACIILIAPVLRIAYLMRGGRLAGVWLAIGLSYTLWLIYDCRNWIARPLPFDQAHAFALLSVVRNPALALTGLSGMLHREAVTAPVPSPAPQ